MSAKTERLAILRRLIRTRKVSNQEDICSLLGTEGHKITQATLSRDLKALKVFKAPDGSGGYHYSLPDMPESDVAGERGSMPIVGIKSIEFSGQLAVIRTRPGYANMVGSILDANIKREIMGTIAGDDTLLLIIREGYGAEQVLSMISEFIPGIRGKYIY
ncbi:MAG: hypothetical protein LKI42_01200 [Bacteroidales bacterium]|jgi:transcriptional regulator of arginine metabolism|nr:hypothetical protein [Bacteroidales bacterium]MCI1785220.1 hypothetical protein [Bacteroidales bacterium]